MHIKDTVYTNAECTCVNQAEQKYCNACHTHTCTSLHRARASHRDSPVGVTDLVKPRHLFPFPHNGQVYIHAHTINVITVHTHSH